jgi:vitamin B12 transporter
MEEHKNNSSFDVVAQLLRGWKALVLIIAFAAFASAQNVNSIKGSVTDEHGAAIRGAEVRLRSRTGSQTVTTTDEAGGYSFRDILPGDYILEVKANGFADSVSGEISLTRAQSITNDIRLSARAINETVVVTASGTPQRADEVSKAVTTVGEDEIETRQEISLPEALRQTPGVRVQQQGSRGAITSIRFRGQRNSDTAILLDGLRVRDSADINGSALPFITDLTATGFDRAELLRGSGSSIYGTNAIGGVINLVPNTASGDRHFEAGFEGGSLALFREHVKGSSGIGRRAGFSFGLTRLDVRRGVDGNDQYGNTTGTGRFQFDLTPAIRIAANFYGSTSNAIINNSPVPVLPGITLRPAIPGVTFIPDINNLGRFGATVARGKRARLVQPRLSKSRDPPPQLQRAES